MLNYFSGKSMKEVKAETAEEGDLGIVAEVIASFSNEKS